jgi:hypothetical protein
LRGLEIVPTHSDFNSTTPKQLGATCPPGKKLVGGGGKIIMAPDGGAEGNVFMTWNGPDDATVGGTNGPASETTWAVRADASILASLAKFQIQAFAVCAFPS